MCVAIRSGRFVSPLWFVMEVAFVVKHDSVELCKDLSVVFHFESPHEAVNVENRSLWLKGTEKYPFCGRRQ